MDINVGSIVRVAAGHEKYDGCFIVVSVEGEYVEICNGKRRKIEKPKRKKLKHIGEVLGESPVVKSNGKSVTNRILRKELFPYNIEREC